MLYTLIYQEMDIQSGFSFEFNINPLRLRGRMLELISSILDHRRPRPLPHALIGEISLIHGQWAPSPAPISRAHEPKFAAEAMYTQKRARSPKAPQRRMCLCHTRRRTSSSTSVPHPVRVRHQAPRYRTHHLFYHGLRL
jgi:hypothetical protein